MARIRTVKLDLWTHEDLSSLPIETHVLAAALLNYADDEGYFNANPKLIQSTIFPLRELSSSVPVMLQELSSIGYVRLFNGTDGKKYGHVCKFKEHQVISHARESKIKLLEDSSNVPVSLHEGSVLNGMEWNKEGNGGGNGKLQRESSVNDLNATDCAMSQARELRISDQRTIEAMRAQIQLEADDSKKSCEYASLKVKSAIEDYQAASEKLAYTLPIDKFLGQGLWRNRDGWPWKNKPANSDWKPATRIDYAAQWKRQEGE